MKNSFIITYLVNEFDFIYSSYNEANQTYFLKNDKLTVGLKFYEYYFKLYYFKGKETVYRHFLCNPKRTEDGFISSEFQIINYDDFNHKEINEFLGLLV